MSASRATSSSVRNPHRSLLARRVATDDAESHPSAYAFPSDPTCPRPIPACARRAASPACGRVDERRADHCSTPQALQPAAVVTSMPCAAHHAVSIVVKPMVAVAISFTRKSASSFRRYVRVRITSASALRTSAAEIAVQGVFHLGERLRTPRRREWRCRQ